MNLRLRYEARIEELSALVDELHDAKRPGDPGAVAGRLLEAVGDLLRRTQRVPCEPKRIDHALTGIASAALRSWFEAVSVAQLQQRLDRAAHEAVEAAIPDGPDDEVTWSSWALQGLAARDRLESACCSLAHMATLGRTDAADCLSQLDAQLTKLDRALGEKACWFTSLNEHRRAEVQLLDAAHRAKAWWFTARTELRDDTLVAALGGAGKGAFEAGSAEAMVSQVVDHPRRRSVSFDELFRYDLGLASAAEKAFIDSERSADPELRRALAALEEGERAIEELEATQGKRENNVVPLRADVGPRSTDGTIVDERPEFKVLLFRGGQRVRLVVHPRREGSLAAAAVFLPDAPDQSKPHKRTDSGFEFDLGPQERLQRVTARVVVSLKNGSSATVAVKL